jgi:hypothetical protein
VGATVEFFSLTADVLRSAIREKLRAGVRRHDVSALVNAYVPQTANTDRAVGGVRRVPIEKIPMGEFTFWRRSTNYPSAKKQYVPD